MPSPAPARSRAAGSPTEAPSQHAERIGPTAHYTAHVWRRIGMPYAEHFSTTQGAVLYWGFFALGEWTTRVLPGVPSMRDYLEYRHRLIDCAVDRIAPGCLVELGAGLTSRAVRWAADAGVPAIELDLPAMAQRKRDRLAAAPASLRARLHERHAIVDADVLDPDLADRLATIVREHARPVVIAEGLLSYFDLPARIRVIASVGRALRAAGGGHFVCDLHTAQAQAQVGAATHVLRAAIRGLTRRRQALDPFADMEALRAAFADAGFDATAAEDPRDHVQAVPRLARLRSPAHVIVASVAAP